LGSEQTLHFHDRAWSAAAALDYPKPDQLMYLTAEAPAIGGTGSALSAPEYIEFRQMNRSFAAVGAYSTGGAAYTTGEVNLTTGIDLCGCARSPSMHICSKRSVFSRSRDASLVTKKLRVGLGRYRHRSQFSPRIVANSIWTTTLVGQKVEIEAAPTNRGISHRADVMDNHTQVWLPLWLIRIWPGNARPMSSSHCATERWRHR